MRISVIGAGLAGSEAAWQLAQGFLQLGLDHMVDLYEMRPLRSTPAHHTDKLAELVCSNSLGSEFLTTARGLLISEMRALNSLIIEAALASKVPAGQALAVDRDEFSSYITSRIENHPRINLIRAELTEIPRDGMSIIATGPLTSEPMVRSIENLLQGLFSPANSPQHCFLRFFDAASPILTADSIDMDIAFRASRYEKGGDSDYINCPFYDQNQFMDFYNALISAERASQKEFEKDVKYFEGCLPIEVIASRGAQTLCFGPMKPVGLLDPRYLKRPIAVVQLRRDNVVGSLYNIVGFQTSLKWGEQKRVFSMIPGLENLEIVRYGVMHRNIYLNSPKFLAANMRLKSKPAQVRKSDPSINRPETGGLFQSEACSEERSEGLLYWVNRASPGRTNEAMGQTSRLWFAGQITGVEGYTESAATGIIAARDILLKLQGGSGDFTLPRETMIGALCHYIANADPDNFQPMNSNWGIINTNPDDMDRATRKNKKLRNEFLARRAQDLLKTFSLSLVS